MHVLHYSAVEMLEVYSERNAQKLLDLLYKISSRQEKQIYSSCLLTQQTHIRYAENL